MQLRITLHERNLELAELKAQLRQLTVRLGEHGMHAP